MKNLPLLFATCALTPFLALPACADFAPAAEMPVVASAAPQIDAAAVTLMNRVAKAYSSRTGVSQKFYVALFVNGVASSGSSGRGLLMIENSKKARLESKIGTKESVYVTDGASFVSQTEPKTYQKSEVKGDPVEQVITAMNWSPQIVLGPLMSGKSPLDSAADLKIESAEVVTKSGMKGVTMKRRSSPTATTVDYTVYLDPLTDLVKRVEVAYERAGKGDAPANKYLNVAEFVPIKTTFTPATFQFAPQPNVVLAATPTRPKYYDEKLVVGAQPYALVSNTLEGQRVSLDAYKGKVVLLDFWATWCGPCIGELPNVKANYEKYKTEGFDIVGISLDGEEDEEKLRTFVKDREMPWAHIYDGKAWSATDAKNYGVRAIPFTLLIGKDGKIAAVNPRGAELEPAIQAAMAR